MVFDKERNKRIIEVYFANQNSVTLTKKAYETECRHEKTPKKVTITPKDIIQKWDELGSAVHDRSRSGRPVTARSNAKENLIILHDDQPIDLVKKLEFPTQLHVCFEDFE